MEKLIVFMSLGVVGVDFVGPTFPGRFIERQLPRMSASSLGMAFITTAPTLGGLLDRNNHRV